MKQGRLYFIDSAKALAVTAMVTQHVVMAIEMNVPKEIIAPYADLQPYLFLTWFMSIFFVITGYCSNYKKEFMPFVSSLVFSIGLPIFFFDIVPKNIENFLDRPLDEALIQIPHTLTRFFVKSFWFLRALFAAKFMYWLLCKYADGNKKLFIILSAYLVAYLAVVNGYGAHGCHSLMALSFIAFGDYMKNNNLLEKEKFCQVCLLTHIVCIVGMYLIGYKPPYFIETIQMTYTDLLWLPIVSISGCVSVMYICQKIGDCKILGFIGQYSLVVYCMHYYIGKLPFFMHIYPTSSFAYLIVYMLLRSCYLIGLCCVFAYIIDRRYFRIIIGKHS